MKTKDINSTLSCTLKCIRIKLPMINKKITLGLCVITFMGACAAPTAMLGPAYTLTSTGSLIQAGASYGSNQLITSYTGKTPMENIQEIITTEKKTINIQKETLESEEFKNLVKKRVEKNQSILKNITQ